MDDELTKPFVPCAIQFDDGDYTEVVLEDAPIVWTVPDGQPLVDLGYDEHGALVAVRISGKHAKRVQKSPR